jgi:hypothetical protein
MTCTPGFGEGETIGFRLNDEISLMSRHHFDQIDIDQAADELAKRGFRFKIYEAIIEVILYIVRRRNAPRIKPRAEFCFVRS